MIRFIPSQNKEKKALTISWTGQAGFILHIPEGPMICIDPYFSNSIERYEGPGCRRLWCNSLIIEQFHPDHVFCSHDHLDHTDPETLPLIYAYSDAVFHGPISSIRHMQMMKFTEDRMSLLVSDRQVSFDGLHIIPKRTHHTEDSLGFLIIYDDIRIYFTGDTALDDSLDFLRDEKIDILIACVNGKYNNMSIVEAAQLCRDSEAQVIIPMHYGLITNNTVPVKDIVETFEAWSLQYFIPEVEKIYSIIRRDV